MSSYEDPDQTTLSIPSLVAFAIISFFTIRYFFFSPGTASNESRVGEATSRQRDAGTAGANDGARRRHATREKIETVASMFPQLNRRDIEWDLERNGGSVQATTERVLREGRLPTPPPNFVAQEAPATSRTGGAAANGGSRTSSPQQTSSSNKASQHSDLITRYNLASRVGSSADHAAAALSDNETIQSTSKQLSKGSWSSNKTERAELLKRRREEMVLAARRKMDEKDRKGKEKETITSPTS